MAALEECCYRRLLKTMKNKGIADSSPRNPASLAAYEPEFSSLAADIAALTT